MPDRIIKWVMQLGNKSKQICKANIALQFLDQCQQTFAWDNNAQDIDMGLVEHDPTHDIWKTLPVSLGL
jgi:hypothetical protein